MADSEPNLSLHKKRKFEGHVGAVASSIPVDYNDEPRRKTVTHTTCLPGGQDPKLLHYLDGHQIIRHGHTPFASGGFCDIFTGDHPQYGKVAMRRPRMTASGYTWSEMSNFFDEAKMWKALRHPNILQFIGLIQSDGYIWAISRFAENGALPPYLKAHPQNDRHALVHQLADAVGYLHRQSIVHGDIKGSNILVSATAAILLCDFGLSKVSGVLTHSSLSGAGSSQWCAPEVLLGETKTSASDVYAFGMTIYEVLNGNAPFGDLANNFLVIKAINDGARPTREPAASESGESYEHLWDIASESWNGIPSSRPSMEVICERLEVMIAGPLGIVFYASPTHATSPQTLPLGTTVEQTGSVGGVVVGSTGGEQMRCGLDDLDDSATNALRVTQERSPQITDITDDEIIQKIPRAKAQYDSSLRRGAQRCLQDTRSGLLQTLHEWIDGTGPHQEPIFWLSGEAGTGKSTIAHTIAEDRDKLHQLGASFFFSRNEEARRDANLFISTLAYQLSVFDKGFKAHLAASLKHDPTLPEKTIKIQLKKMVMEPLKKTATLASGILVIVVDALDECSPVTGVEEILEAWAELVKDFPLRLLITSRPAWHIQARFSSSKHLSTVFHLHDISKTIVKSDVEHYLRVSLADVLGGDLADDDLGRLSQRVGLLFILASTYVKYIKDPIRKNPPGQLRALLSRTPTLGRTPEGELNALYLDIVNGVPEDSNSQDVVNAFNKVVGTMIVSSIPMTPIQLSSLLKMDEGDVLYVLRRLSSVIFLPDDSAPASFFHQSFSEFLTDSKRCTNPLYVMDKSEAHRHMAFRCLDSFDEHLQLHPEFTVSHQVQEPSEPNNLLASDDQLFKHSPAHDSEIPEAISLSTSKAYSESLCYACVYFSYHLQGMMVKGNDGDAACLERFEAFYTQKRTQWMDVLASLHDIAGLNDLPARLHSGFIKYFQHQGAPSQQILNQMISFQRKLQPLPPSQDTTVPGFVPPIPPDVASSSEPSAVLQGQGYNPDSPPHSSSRLGRLDGLQPPPGSPQQGFIGVPESPYAPPAGFQDYAAPSPYPYAPAGGFPYTVGAPLAAAIYGDQIPTPFMTPYTTPLLTPGLLDLVTPSAQSQGLGGMEYPGPAGGGGRSVVPDEQPIDGPSGASYSPIASTSASRERTRRKRRHTETTLPNIASLEAGEDRLDEEYARLSVQQGTNLEIVGNRFGERPDAHN